MPPAVENPRSRAQPAMLRLYDESSAERKLIGTTSFFRNRSLLRTVLEQLDPNAEELNVLVHASSIGCDVYSFVIAYELFFAGQRCPRLKCFATDLSPVFLERAKNAVYPAEVLREMFDCEQVFFEKIDDQTCRVRQDIRDRVTILPAASYCEFKSDARFDIVFLLNSLLYVSEPDQARTLDTIAGYNTSLLVATGFHPDQIQKDLERNHYKTITDNFEEIYNAWTCRRSIAPGTMIDGITYCSPAMEDLRPCPDYHYRFGALFKKQTPRASTISPRLKEAGPHRNDANASKPRLRVALFNDTGNSPHVGCKGVTLAHDAMLARAGSDIVIRAYLGEYRELWKGDRASSLRAFWKSDLPERLAGIDAVIVNGEGTIHHGAGLHLLTVLAGAQEIGLPTFLVNAVFQECEQDLQTLKQLTDFTVRDAASSAYLKRLGVPHRVVLDSILEASFDTAPKNDFRNKIVITDWHFARNQDVGLALQKLLRDLGQDAVFYPLEGPDREKDWRHALADFSQAALIVTGRHHGVCLAGLAGVPFVALGSNTWKVEGMLKLLPGNLSACADMSELPKRCEEAFNNRAVFGEIKQFLRAQLPLTTFEKLASCSRVDRPAPRNAAPAPKEINLDWRSDCATVTESQPKLCLATNYLLMTEANRQIWISLDRHLEANGCRLVLMTSAIPDEPLPFPVIPIPFLLRDYPHQFPNAVEDNALISSSDLKLLDIERARDGGRYPAGEALRGLLACRKLVASVLEKLQPSYVLTWDSSSPLAMIVAAQARSAGIPIQAFERGLLPETMAVDSMGLQAWSDMRMNWLAQIPTASARDEAAYQRIREYYLRNKPKKYDQPDFGEGGQLLRETLGLKNKKVVVFFGGGFEASALLPRSNHHRHHLAAFHSTNDALLRLWGILEKDPNTTLIFKPHPLDLDPYAIAKVQGVKVVTDVNVHALMDLADVVAVQFTTLQFEVAFYEKPILLLGRSAWWGRNATYEVDRAEDLQPTLMAALARKDWTTKQANAHAFINQIAEQYLIGTHPEVPTRRHIEDFARFIANTSLDARDLAPAEERWAQTEGAVEALKPKVSRAANPLVPNGAPAPAKPAMSFSTL